MSIDEIGQYGAIRPSQKAACNNFNRAYPADMAGPVGQPLGSIPVNGLLDRVKNLENGLTIVNDQLQKQIDNLVQRVNDLEIKVG